MGIEVLPPDINASERTFTVHGLSIRFGLGAVKGVGGSALEAIFEARREEPFTSLFDFCERVDLRRVNKKVIEALIKCGAFATLDGNRAQYMAALEEAVDMGQRIQREKALGQESLFGSTEIVSQTGNGHGKLPDIEEWDDKILLGFEKEAIGFYISGHPLDRHRDALKRFASCETAALSEFSDKSEVRVAGMVSGLKELMTKKGDRMAFASLEDLSGFVELVVFPEAYQAGSELLKGEEPILVSGALDVGEEACKVLVNEIVPLADAQQQMTRRVHFRLAAEGLDDRRLRELKSLMERHRGKCEAVMHMQLPGTAEAVISLPRKIRVAASDGIKEDTTQLFGYNVVTFE